MWSDISNQIGNLRVRGAGADTPALRLTLSGLFNNIDIKPPGAHPTAILIIRHMMDPMPGTLMDHGGIRRINPSWEKAMQISLSEVYKDAERPVNGHISPNVKAVLFVDEGEMLACLALDMTKNEVMKNWWWKVIMRKLSSPSLEGLKTFLSKEASFLPAFIQYLDKWGKAYKVLNSFSSVQIMTLLFAMAHAYDLNDLSLKYFNNIPLRNKFQSGTTSSVNMPGSERGEDLSSYNLQAPWERWFSLKPPSNKLTKERQCLLGLGLSLHHYPYIVRSTVFKNNLNKWWAYAQVHTDEQSVDNINMLSLTSQKAKDNKEGRFKTKSSDIKSHRLPKKTFIYPQTKSSITQPSNAQTENIANIDGRSLINEQSSLSEPSRPWDDDTKKIYRKGSVSRPPPSYIENIEKIIKEGHIHIRGRSRFRKHDILLPEKKKLYKKQEIKEEEAPTHPYSLKNSLSTKNPDANQYGSYSNIQNSSFREGSLQDFSIQKEFQASREKSNTTMPIVASLFQEGVTTRLGGILYLINIMQYLDLPACFEEDWALASQIGSWGTLEILGRALLGPDHEYLKDDPIWEALAYLNGRKPVELPGKNFRKEKCFRLPVKWLAKIKGGKEKRICFWATNGKRLCIWSKKGYLLADVPRNDEKSLKQAEAELLACMGNSFSGLRSGNLKRKSFDHVPHAKLSSPLIKGLNPDLIHWMAMVFPYIIFCLRLAFNIKDKNSMKGLQSITELGEVLLLYKGRFYVTSTHVDLVFGIDDISLPVRMAGFDCNPGWLPDFGRVILFHFE
ncbi:MAG: hypothetical protein ACMUIU_01535 [bacterium]